MIYKRASMTNWTDAFAIFYQALEIHEIATLLKHNLISCSTSWGSAGESKD